MKKAFIYFLLFIIFLFIFSGEIKQFYFLHARPYITFYEYGGLTCDCNVKANKILAIGDSQTAVHLWQEYLSIMLNSKVKTHAKGGIGLIKMVDGDEAQENIGKHDPNDFGVKYLKRLTENETKDVDYIFAFGFYNEYQNAVFGNKNDLYPNDNTFCAKFNYFVTRVKEELSKANNKKCRIVIVSPHCFGNNCFNKINGYDISWIPDSLNMLCEHNDVLFCDAYNLSGIDSTNWNTYHLSDKDKLHLNKEGQFQIAKTIYKYLNDINP